MSAALEEIAAVVAAHDCLEPVGARTHACVGDPVTGTPVSVRAPAGIVRHDPADLTVTVRAGTRVRELLDELAPHGQMVPLDPRDDGATVGGVIAAGLSGLRRLRYGPVRDCVLAVRVMGSDGVLRSGGGPTVKNVTGYDIPRLLVGSLGTLGLITDVVLRCRPRPAEARWYRTEAARASEVGAACHGPSAIVVAGEVVSVLLEGGTAEIEAQARAAGLEPGEEPPWPEGEHRGRISVPPARLGALAGALTGALREHAMAWRAEWGVGTVHVAAADAEALHAARAIAHAHDGWLLREAGGGAGFAGFGIALPNTELAQRVKAAFDPRGAFAPGRLPW